MAQEDYWFHDKKALPTPQTKESAEQLVEQHAQLEGEYRHWTAEANATTAELVQLEQEIRMNLGLKKEHGPRIKALKRRQEEIRLGQGARQKRLFPLRDKARQAERWLGGQVKASEHRNMSEQNRAAEAELAQKMKTEMYDAKVWVEAWNQKFGAVFNLDLDKIMAAETAAGGKNINTFHLNGHDFEAALWKFYQESKTMSVKVNQNQFRTMVREVLKKLSQV